MKLKTNYKEWLEGDTFALEIKEADKEFNGKYLILIKCKVKDYDTGEYWDDNNGKDSFFRFKITKDKTLPKTQEEVEQLEFVKVSFRLFEERYLPYDGRMTIKELIKNRSKVEFYPDEYGFIYTYIESIHIRNNADCEKLIYLGNFEISKPDDEYIPFNIYNCKFYDNVDTIVKFLIKRYKSYNQKNCILYTSEEYRKELKSQAKEKLDMYGGFDKKW